MQPEAGAGAEAESPTRVRFQWSSAAHRALDSRNRALRSPRGNGDGSDDAASQPDQRPGEPQIKLQAV